MTMLMPKELNLLCSQGLMSDFSLKNWLVNLSFSLVLEFVLATELGPAGAAGLTGAGSSADVLWGAAAEPAFGVWGGDEAPDTDEDLHEGDSGFSVLPGVLPLPLS